MNFILKFAACIVVLSPLSCGVQSAPAPTPSPEPVASQSQGLTTLNWSGYTWNVKQCTACGPGPNNFDSSSKTVWIDSTGSLNLSVHKASGKWYCGEVWLPTALGHGTYEFFIKTRTDIINQNLVNAGFLYQDDTHELDVEWSRWGNASNPNNGDFAIQPSPIKYWHQDIVSGNWQKDRIIWTTTDGGSDQVEFQVETNSIIVQDWVQTLTTPVDPSLALAHINNWMFQGKPPTDGATEVMTLVSFTFTPQP
jgi:hypothetical protein